MKYHKTYWNEHYGRWCRESVNEVGNTVRVLYPACYPENRGVPEQPLGRLLYVRSSLTTESKYTFEEIGVEPDGAVVMAWAYRGEEDAPPPEPQYSDEIIAKLKGLDGPRKT